VLRLKVLRLKVFRLKAFGMAVLGWSVRNGVCGSASENVRNWPNLYAQVKVRTIHIGV